MWILRINKVVEKASRANIAVATNLAISQLKKTRQMIQEHPDNENLKHLEYKFMRDLEDCYRKEEAAEIENPLENAKRLMALDEYELEQWIDAFELIDIEKKGRISVQDLFKYIDEHLSETGRAVFADMNAIDADGFMEFGDFMLGVGTFCFFGSDEVLKFLYNAADKENAGIIIHANYIELLNDLHPFDKSRAIRALKAQKRRPGDEISFDEFVKTNARFPAILFPFYKLQKSLRSKIIGEAWWLRKLVKYSATRNKIVDQAELLDRKAEAELLAFDENEERKARMRERARLISQETSAVKLAILKARQFTDALK